MDCYQDFLVFGKNVNGDTTIVYPNKNKYVDFWNGPYSIMNTNGSISKYILNVLNDINKDISFIISRNDGILSDYGYNDILNKLNKNSLQIVGTLCTRYINYPNILYIPLDDETFTNGLTHILNDIPNIEWENKISKVFWRGGSSGGYPSQRTKTVELLYNYSNADVKLIYWEWNLGMSIPNEYFGDRCNLETHFKHKYILIIDGNCIASNHQWVFGSGSVPIMITHSENNWWFKKYLVPMENYVPVNYDLSDLQEKIDWLIENDDEAKKIMMNAMELSKTLFSHQGQSNYIKEEIYNLINNNMDNIYYQKCNDVSDINEHLPVLFNYASKCDTIVECGVREPTSSYAFVKGLKGNIHNKFTMIDPYKSDKIDCFLEQCHKNKVNTSFILGSDLDCELINTDLLFIDSLHIYGQLKRELEYWNKHVNKYIIMHDTTSFELQSESRYWSKTEYEHFKNILNMTDDEINKGLWYAVEEFIKNNASTWKIEKRYTNNNGLTILSRI